MKLLHNARKMLKRLSIFDVKITGRAGLLYKEGGKVLVVDSEMLVGDSFDMVIYVDSINRWAPPYDQVLLSEKDKKSIINNIKEKLHNIQIDWQ